MHHRQLSPKVSVSTVFVVGMFMSIMDGTIVNVALPSIGHQLGVPSTSIDAVVVSYLLSLAVVIPASGWLGDRWGTKRVFLVALALFTIASALCGLASNFTMLVFFRFLQGAAGGALAPVGTAMLYRTFPPAERVRISSILIIPTVIAPATGPVLGGLLVDSLSWRWVFFVNVPLGIAAFLFGLLFLQEHREPKAGRFDLPGFLLVGIGLALALYALSEGPTSGWTSLTVLGSSLGGLLLLSAFIVVELRKREPLLVPHRQPGLPGLQCRFPRCALRRSAVLAARARGHAPHLWADDIPRGTGSGALFPDCGPALSSRRAAPPHGGRAHRCNNRGRAAIADRTQHKPVADARAHISYGGWHGLRVHARADRHLRNHLVGRYRAGVGAL